MDLTEIQKLISEFNESATREMEIETDGFHLRLSKNEVTAQLLQQLSAPTQQTVSSSVENSSNENKNEQTAALQEEGRTIKSPMVGSVYLQPKPTEPAYVEAGTHVHKGDVVCIIEAMKMMTEIKSDVDGVVKEVLVNNEELVEFDQPLFRVEED
ncbi:acetyl-CoA carboxylase biotin carboxyl carrier protein [Liquorilactobacillus oeni]|uniref:Biotin carboxyl carrier protein of acetyl-CoA carboxylase n=1 Tax=Liquorilactobacillus oeni DSM 19972 TaxID=1423777 RepID=A0A0R1MAS1_9LACO|nr:acetyl-CoA carboxylase biotin carboxyl carrier protein [Liquorilactobacillus oeni]KRL04985.1 biotin carboxyl carrier protein of acetyl-CoA carboxylase [Liquorilactobacillus oeni DSM 19972]